jgi:antitoxin component YwqK of YwqJK toxin-antitoxin module
MSKYNLSIQYKGNIGYCFLDSFNGYYTDDNGKKKANYVDGKVQGEYIGYYESGAVQYKGNSVDGNAEGELKYYTINGEIDKIENYKDGELIED